ncbi:hypothetical protein DSECCO2_597350 [anaerobic digester metagenome]
MRGNGVLLHRTVPFAAAIHHIRIRRVARGIFDAADKARNLIGAVAPVRGSVSELEGIVVVAG